VTRETPAGGDSWDLDRLMHRQIYIDLIRSYLADYGSQYKLARALGISEAYVSYLLEPLRVTLSPRQALHWSTLLCAAGHEVAEAFKYVKTPAQLRAQQIADQLLTDGDRREVLLYHVRLARQLTPARPDSAVLSGGDARALLQLVGDTHQAALYDPAELVTAASYAQVWRQARDLPARIDPRFNPAEHAQALMFLHDTAQVLGRPDLALGFARRALRALPASRPGSSGSPAIVRLRVNAIFAEIVTLNTLGLRADAVRAGQYAQSLPAYDDEPQTWLRSFLEQRLVSMSGLHRTSIYLAERTAGMAMDILPDDRLSRVGISRRLMDVYLSRPTPRSTRNASRLADGLHQAVAGGSGLSSLRRVQILRTLIRYHQHVGDPAAASELIARCVKVATEANLVHQRDELAREVRGKPTDTSDSA
jgi:hypothetical protein